MTAMNESTLSSSSKILYGQDKSNNKRSISSSILNLFNRIKFNNGNNESEIDGSYPNESVQQIRKKKRLGYTKTSPSYNNSSINNSNNNNNSDYHITHSKGTNSNMEEPLILYETDDNGQNDQNTSASSIRPPILPILPIQRLKLLRQKQMLRLKQDTKLIQNIDSDDLKTDTNNIKLFKSNNIKTSDCKQYQTLPYPEPFDFNQSGIIQKPDTPSPVKNPSHIDELMLDSATNNIIVDKQHNKNISNNHKGLIQLQSKRLPKKVNKTRFKGTRWSGNFEYDLSEYDTKPKISTTSNVINSISDSIKQSNTNKNASSRNSSSNSSSNNNKNNNIEINTNGNMTGFEYEKTLKIPISKFTEFSGTSITNKKLSKNKLDLLIHGSKLQQKSKHNEILAKDDTVAKDVNENSEKKGISLIPVGKTKNENNNNGDDGAGDDDNNPVNKKSNIVLPTAGFDFLKDDDTLSKNITFSFNNQNKVEDNTDKKDYVAKNSLFSFSNTVMTGNDIDVGKKKEDKNTNNKSKLSFSFNAKSESNSNQKEESAQQKSSSPAISIDMTKDIKKPTFTFTANKNTDIESKPLSFSLGSQSIDKTNDKDNTTAPKFSFGSTISTFGNSASTDTAKTFSFAFGTKSKIGKNDSNDSRDNNEDNDEDDNRPRKKPAFSFTAPSTSGNKNSDTGITNVSTVIEPSFSFGSASQATDKKDKDGKEANKPPSFTFGLTDSSTEKKPLSFSFGSTPKTTETKISTSLRKTPSEENKPSSLKFITNVSNAKDSEEPDSKKRNIFSFEKNPSGDQATSTKTTTPTAAASTGKPSFTFGAGPTSGTSGTIQSSFLFNNKSDDTNNESSAKPSFTFGTTANSTSGKVGTTALSKPSFSFNTTNKQTSSTSTTISPNPSSSFNKPAGIMNLQLNNDAKSLGVSLTNPLLSKPSGSNATSNATSTQITGAGDGFKFTRQQALPLSTNIGQQNSTSASGTSLFSGNTALPINSMQANSAMNNNNNLGGNQGFNFTFNASNNNNNRNNSTMNSFGNNANSSAPPGGSVFSFNNSNISNNMFSHNNNINGSGFNFGQQQQSQVNNTFHPSSQVNINFNQNANANPIEIFSGSLNNNNGIGNTNNTINPQANQFPHRKIARMRASRR